MTGTLEGHYVLDEDSGSTAYDYSGNENHGTVANGGDSTVVGATTGPFSNSAYTFDGSNDNISVSNSPLPNPIDYATISVWFNENSSGQIVSNEDGQDGIRIRTDGTNLVFDALDTDNSITIGASASYNQSEWNHAVGVWNSSTSTTHLYLNGIEVASSTNTGVGTVSNESGLGIASRAPADETFFWGGSVSDVRIYSRILSPQEIQYLYQSAVESEATFEVQEL